MDDVLVMTDSYTKYAVAVPCRDQSASTVARVLRDHWFPHYGVPAQIHSDQGRNFESRLIRELCNLSSPRRTQVPTTPLGMGKWKGLLKPSAISSNRSTGTSEVGGLECYHI